MIEADGQNNLLLTSSGEYTSASHSGGLILIAGDFMWNLYKWPESRQVLS
jgi:hypothetical protein